MSKNRRGFSVIELLIVIAIIVTIIAVAVPQYEKAQWAAHEAAALGHIRTLHTAQVQYQAQYGRYATSLAELGPPAAGDDGPSGANLIPKRLAAGSASRYRFVMTGTPSGYKLQAVPEAKPGANTLSFFTDETRSVRENRGTEPAGPGSPEVDR
jgi:type IV pilus assembly protein PilA